MKYINTIKERRIHKQLTQKQVALLLNLTNSQDRISDWEQGIRLPTLYTIYKLCEILEITPYDLYPDISQK